jgi:hypothetical protein
MKYSLHRILKLAIIPSLFLTLIISCQPKTRIMDMNTKLAPAFENSLKDTELNKTCDNQAVTLSLTKALIADMITVESEVANVDIEHLDCKNKIIWKGHGPEKSIRTMIEIPAPISTGTTSLTTDITQNENRKINYIQIENTRTCTVQRITPAEDQIFDQKEITLENGSIAPLLQPYKTMANSKGAIKLLITDLNYRTDANALNVRDNDNIIKIQYFGKCLVYKHLIDEKQTDAFNCETAELIGSKELYLNLKVKRPERQNTKQVPLCFSGTK